jgi:hypothetical protein
MRIRKQRLIGENGHNATHYGFYNQPNSAGGGAGQPVTVSFATTFQDQFGQGVLPEDGRYSVAVNPGQSATAYATNKTSSGFSVVLTPVPSTGTLAVGTFDLIVLGGR